MAGATSTLVRSAAGPVHRPLTEPRWVQVLLIAAALTFLGFFLLLPTLAVFVNAFQKGWEAYRDAIADPMSLAAIRNIYPRSSS
jgi:sulfate transport system permease protein